MGYATLGDVTTPTGGDPGLFSQVYDWFTGSVANAANEPANVQRWMAEVRARGNAVLRYPKTDGIGTAGDLAERETNRDTDGSVLGYSYYLAPQDVIDADRTLRGLSKLAPVTARVAEAGESLGKGLEAPIVKGALIVGGVLLAVNLLPALLRKR